MPIFEWGDAEIHYEVHGSGHTLLLLAPGGMRSAARWWREQPGAPGTRPRWINPMEDLSDSFRVIAMDQRNAGASSAPIRAGDSWQTYLDDQLALMDHVGAERFHVMGGCIGCSYALGLCRLAPERVTAAVLQNPIGLTADNRESFFSMFDDWMAEMRPLHPEVNDRVAAGFREGMFGGDFVFTATEDFLRHCRTPLLVMPGDDNFHPRLVAEQIAELAAGTQFLDPWGGEHRADTLRQVRTFLTANTP